MNDSSDIESEMNNLQVRSLKIFLINNSLLNYYFKGFLSRLWWALFKKN